VPPTKKTFADDSTRKERDAGTARGEQNLKTCSIIYLEKEQFSMIF